VGDEWVINWGEIVAGCIYEDYVELEEDLDITDDTQYDSYGDQRLADDKLRT